MEIQDKNEKMPEMRQARLPLLGMWLLGGCIGPNHSVKIQQKPYIKGSDFFMTDNDDITRINSNIKKLENRIAKLKANGSDNGAIEALSKEKFNQQRILNVIADGYEPYRPVKVGVLLKDLHAKFYATHS